MILTSLMWIKLVKSEFHLLMDTGQLVLNGLSFLFNFLSLKEDFIKLSFEFFILIFDVLVSDLDIFRSGINSEFIKSKIIIGKLSLKISDFICESLESFLKFIIKLLFLIDSLSFISKFICFLLNVHHLLFDLCDIIISIINFSLSCYSLRSVYTSTCC